MAKNPHAVALGQRGGKKGGLAKVRKGFAAMPAAEAKWIRALAAQRRADSRRLDAVIEHGLIVSAPCIGYEQTIARYGVWTPDEDCLARSADPREAIDLAIAKLSKKSRNHELS